MGYRDRLAAAGRQAASLLRETADRLEPRLVVGGARGGAPGFAPEGVFFQAGPWAAPDEIAKAQQAAANDEAARDPKAMFWDPFAHGKFGQYLFRAYERRGIPYTHESAHQVIEEAQLVVEAAYSCYARMQAAKLPVKVKA